MKRIAVLFADGFEEIELVAVVDILRRAGVKTDLVSIGNEYVTSARNLVIKADMLMDDTDLESYDGIFIPGGGKGAENLKNSGAVLKALKKADSNEKIIAAICAGPTVLQEAGILNGTSVTSYPGMQEFFIDANYINNVVSVIDGNILTSRGPATAPYFAFDILEALGLDEESEKIFKDMQYEFLAEEEDPEEDEF